MREPERGTAAATATGTNEALRFGLVTDGAPLERWQRNVLERLAQLHEVHADCWLLTGAATAPVDPFAHAAGNGSVVGNGASAPVRLSVAGTGSSELVTLGPDSGQARMVKRDVAGAGGTVTSGSSASGMGGGASVGNGVG